MTAEEAIKRCNLRFEAAAKAVEGVLWTNNIKGEIQTEQLGWAELTGQTFDEYKGFGWTTALHPDDTQPTVEAWKDALKFRKVFKFEHRVKMANGEYGLFSVRAVPMLDENGTLLEWVGVHSNITERRKSEQRLLDLAKQQDLALSQIKENERVLQRIFLQAPVSIVVYEGENHIVKVASEVGLELWGKKEEEVIGRPFFEVSPELREGQEGLLKHVLKTGEPFIGHEFPVNYVRYGKEHFLFYNFVFQPLRNDVGEITAVVSIGNDVTDSVLARKKIEESEEQFKTFADNIQNLAWMADGEGSIYWYNNQWYKYTGASLEEMEGWGWQKVHHPDHLKRVVDFVTNAWQKGEAFEMTFPIRKFDGSFKWFLTRVFPVKDNNGAVVRWIGTNTDIDEQKNMAATLESMVAQRTFELRQSNDDLQQFAHVISHDLKEPVRKIQTFISIVHTKYLQEVPEEVKTFLGKIMTAAERINAMVDGVLGYSSFGSTERGIIFVDLHAVLKTIWSDLELVVKQKKAELELAELPMVEGAEVLYYQLFYNLIYNALKFSKPETPVKISIQFIREQKAERAYVHLKVSDNGIGFESAQNENIFKPFNRLHSKDKYEGTGLGLALCKKIVERHGGTMTAAGKLNEGATFDIVLPIRQSGDSI